MISIGIRGCDHLLVDEETGAVSLPHGPVLHAAVRTTSGLCRFAGQIPFYSVTEHSVLLARLLLRMRGLNNRRVFARAALIHDLPEGLGIGDINAGLKRVFAPQLKHVEMNMLEELWDWYGQSPLAPWGFLHVFDHALGQFEADHFGFYKLQPSDWLTELPDGLKIEGWSAVTAEAMWWQVWTQL